MLVDFTNCGF